MMNLPSHRFRSSAVLRKVVFYAGDNDIQAQRTPEQIAADFAAFENTVHAALPATEIGTSMMRPHQVLKMAVSPR